MSVPLTQDMQFARDKLVVWPRDNGLLGAHALADVLDGCSKRQPCRSAACPICGLAFQAAVVDVVDKFVARPARAFRDRMYAATVVPDAGCIAFDDLAAATFRKVAREISAAFVAVDLPPAIIGLEASFNEDQTGVVAQCW